MKIFFFYDCFKYMQRNLVILIFAIFFILKFIFENQAKSSFFVIIFI